MNKFAYSIAEAREALLVKSGEKFVQLLQNGSMQVEYYAPGTIDEQTPHRQDELYIIASGSSGFYRGGTTIHCEKGDIIFVPAGMEHRFINISADFATWVIFYGPDGGEQPGRQ